MEDEKNGNSDASIFPPVTLISVCHQFCVDVDSKLSVPASTSRNKPLLPLITKSKSYIANSEKSTYAYMYLSLVEPKIVSILTPLDPDGLSEWSSLPNRERVGQKKEKDRSNDNLDDRQTQRPARDQNDAEPDSEGQERWITGYTKPYASTGHISSREPCSE
ncbi:hypothetical protein RRG08_050203 [Elysia crispata]|uniref:Uncharacterized protein n=1 Tax=Elysia crispata TaxID=231223 RepID=A0AAE0Z6Q7_9GAST|nr:hypothetical protein RRG08_050203 [Elysia crispata]